MAKLFKLNVSVSVQDVELDANDYIVSDSINTEQKLADLERRIVVKDDHYDRFVEDKLWELLHLMSDRASRIVITK